MNRFAMWKTLGWIGLVLVVLALPALAQTADVPGADVRQPGSEVSYFTRFVVGGGWITWLILLPLSVAMVALVIVNVLATRRAALLPTAVMNRVRQMCRQRQLQGLEPYLAKQPDMFSQVMRAGLGDVSNGAVAIQRTLDEATEQQAASLMRRNEWLNLIGNIAPMIGLFGTVTGMIQAFYELVEISRAGGVSNAAQLADAISLALVTTFWGLAVAIPALTAFAILRNRIDALAAECWLVVDDLLAQVAQINAMPVGPAGRAPKPTTS